MSGKVSGHYKVIQVTPTISTSAYTAGDQVGGLQTLTIPGQAEQKLATLLSVSLVDKAAQNAALTIFFFTQSPTIASSDNAAFDLTDANMLYYAFHVNITASDYASSSSNSAASLGMSTVAKCAIPTGTAPTALYAVIKTTGTPTYASTSDLQITYTFGLDQ